MKKIIFAFTLVCSLTMNGQDWPGESIELLDGKELKVMPLTDGERGYHEFYTNEACTRLYKSTYTIYNKPEALQGKIFKVISYKPLSPSEYVIKLDNPETGVLYYKYNSKKEQYYYLEAVGGLNYPEGFFCRDITGSGGKLYVTANSTVERNAASRDTPRIEGVKVRYYPAHAEKYEIAVEFKQESDKKETDIKTVKFILENGAEILAKGFASVSPAYKGYQFSGLANLTNEQWLQFKESPIVKIVIAAHEHILTRGKRIQEYIKCIDK